MLNSREGGGTWIKPGTLPIELVIGVHSLDAAVLVFDLLLRVDDRWTPDIEVGTLPCRVRPLLLARLVQVILDYVLEDWVVLPEHLHELTPVATLDQEFNASLQLLVLVLHLSERFLPRCASLRHPGLRLEVSTRSLPHPLSRVLCSRELARVSCLIREEGALFWRGRLAIKPHLIHIPGAPGGIVVFQTHLVDLLVHLLRQRYRVVKALSSIYRVHKHRRVFVALAPSSRKSGAPFGVLHVDVEATVLINGFVGSNLHRFLSRLLI